MSLRPTPCRDNPAATAAVARAAFPHGNPYQRLRDQLGAIFADSQFAPLFAPCRQPAECRWRVALVSVLQVAENIPNRRAALKALAFAAPAWLRAHVNPARLEWYCRRADDYNVPQG